jgi:hypothetical protein
MRVAGTDCAKMLRASMSRPEGNRMRSLAGIVLLLVAVALGVALLFRDGAVFNPPLTEAADLSKLFKGVPGETLDASGFFDLRDPACTKAFPLHLTKRTYIQMSRNCQYSLYVDNGRVTANFLNASKGAIELAPGRTWSAADFWSIRPVTAEADIRLEPMP